MGVWQYADPELPDIPAAEHSLTAMNALLTGPLCQWPCACRKPRPCRSRGIFVLVEDSAEALAPSYVQPGDLVGVGDRWGQRGAWSDVRDAPVRSVLVIPVAPGMDRVVRRSPFRTVTRARLHPDIYHS
jgi:hypothetical protein